MEYWKWYAILAWTFFLIPEIAALYLSGNRTLSHYIIDGLQDNPVGKAFIALLFLWLIGHWVAEKW